MDPTLDGSYVFGTACRVQHIPNPVARQDDAFFGIGGVASLMGGSRGRTFEVRGLLVGDGADDGEAIAAVMEAEAALLAYADGIARTFTDTQGRSWPNVILTGEYRASPDGPRPCTAGGASPDGPRPCTAGWCLPYSCVLRGLS